MMKTEISPFFGRIEASIFGESALIDRETGQVYWEGGSSNSLYESLTPKLDQFGVEHAQATVLTILMTLAFLSVLSGWLRRAIESCCGGSASNSSWSARTVSMLVILAEWTVLKLPTIENKWLVSAILILYLIESYNCSTRCFLSNTVPNATELDSYIDGLRDEQPVVTWNVKTFHYELRRLFVIPRMIGSFLRSLKKSRLSQELAAPAATSELDSATTSLLGLGQARKSSRHTAPMFLITRKVVTNKVSESYSYTTCEDKTIAGVWSRAPSDSGVPFRKLSLSKVLVLSDKRSREDYFRQQSDFVTRYGREDEFAEFSTSIEVSGYRPKLLVTRSIMPNNYAKYLFRLPVFWIFTCFGLTVPYRIWFKRHCDFLRVTVVKETTAKSATESYLRSWFPSQASLRFSNKTASH